MYRPSVLLLVFLLIGITGKTQDKASQAPEQKNFSLSPDNFRALQNSVNLFTGQVSFPMDLASLIGRGGLNASVSVQYNSAGVPLAAKTENEYSPTGILGLGWSMEISKIVADHKQTGTRHDDDFYLVENGASNKLICTSYYNTPRTFASKNFNPWKVEYYPAEEKWVITRENGFRFTYKPVQWMVKWGNWIGNSVQHLDQSRLAYVWGISEIENLWGDKITFEYQLVEEKMGSNPLALKHTKAYYLKKIVDPIGQSVEFIYSNKTTDEYKDPHVEQPEPDGYQEKFETLFLDELIVKSSGNFLLYTVDLEYELISSDNIVKRYLKEIRKEFPSGQSEPPIRFEYFTSGNERGCLKQVINSLGAHIDYYYSTQVIPESNRLMYTSSALPEDYEIYVGGDFVIVTYWASGTVHIDAYTWDKRWIVEELWEVSNIEKEDFKIAEMALDQDHFIYRVYSEVQNRHFVYAAHRRPYDIWTNGWNKVAKSIVNPNEDGRYTARVFSGENFTGFLNRFEGKIHLFNWINDTWDTDTLSIDHAIFQNFVAAGGNFIFLHNDAGIFPDSLYFYYLDAEMEWKKRSLPPALAFSTDGANIYDSYWHAANSFVLGLPQYNPEYIYMWDEEYQNFTRENELGEWTDASPVFIFSGGQIGITERNTHNAIYARYDGKYWKKKNFQHENYSNSGEKEEFRFASFGEDYVVTHGPPFSIGSPYQPYLNVIHFNPSTLTWNEEQKFGLFDGAVQLNNQNGRVLNAGINMFVSNGAIYTRSPNGSWVYSGTVPLNQDDYLIGGGTFVMAPNYIVYEYSTTVSGDEGDVYIIYLENGKVKGYERIEENSSVEAFAGLSTLVTKEGALAFYRIIGGKYKDDQSALVVKSTAWSDGNQLFETSYEYTHGKPVAEDLAQFNLVTVIPGGTSSSKPYGYTKYYFYYPGIEFELTKEPPVLNEGYEKLLSGLLYRAEVYTAVNGGVSTTLNYYEVFSNEIKNSTGRAIDLAYYVRPVRTDQTLDGVTSTVENTYDELTGMQKETVQQNSASPGNVEEKTTTYTYWWEKYDTARVKNILSPVVQTKTVNSINAVATNQSTHSAVTKWKYYSSEDKYSPEMTYEWKHTGSPDFTAWSNAAVPSSDWLLVSTVNVIDTDDGTVFETEQYDGTVSATIFDHTHTRPLAQATHASYNQIAYSGFEDEAQGNWSYDSNLLITGNALTGTKSLQAGALTDAYISKEVPAGTYELSFWHKDATSIAEADNGTVAQSANEEVKNGWTLTRSIVQVSSGTGTVKVRVPAGGMVDEVRLKPQAALMTTYVYNADGSLKSETDTNLLQASYEYDTQYRLTVVRDHRGQIVKTYNYHYRNE